MRKLVSEVAEKRYKVTVYGVTDKMDTPFSYTHASSPESALTKVMHKIVRAAQERPGANWKYTDTGFSAYMNQQQVGIIIKHLLSNTSRWKAEEV